MEFKQMENHYLALMGKNVKSSKKMTDNDMKSKSKCSQCGYVSSRGDHLRIHLKTHNGKKSNKCNQCDYVASRTFTLRQHLKTHSGEKSNKCSQCDFTCSDPSYFKRHKKRHSSVHYDASNDIK